MGVCSSSEAAAPPTDAHANNNNDNATNPDHAKPNLNGKSSSKDSDPTTTVVASNNTNHNSNANNVNNNKGVSQTVTSPSQSSSSSSSSSLSGQEADEFRDTASLVVLLVLERLVRALEVEREPLIIIAQRLHSSCSPLTLVAGATIERFIRQLYNIDDKLAPPFDTHSTASNNIVSSSSSQKHISNRSLQIANDDLNRFVTLINTAQQVGYRQPLASVEEVGRALVSLANSMKQELNAASAHSETPSDIKLSLSFFSRTLDFATKGDIVAQPSLLFQNIDDLTNH